MALGDFNAWFAPCVFYGGAPLLIVMFIIMMTVETAAEMTCHKATFVFGVLTFVIVWAFVGLNWSYVYKGQDNRTFRNRQASVLLVLTLAFLLSLDLIVNLSGYAFPKEIVDNWDQTKRTSPSWCAAESISGVHIAASLVGLFCLTYPSVKSPSLDMSQKDDTQKDDTECFQGNDSAVFLNYSMEWLDIVFVVIALAVHDPDSEAFGLRFGHTIFAFLLIKVYFWMIPLCVLIYIFPDNTGHVSKKIMLRLCLMSELGTDLPEILMVLVSHAYENNGFIVLMVVFNVCMTAKSILFNPLYYELFDCGCFRQPGQPGQPSSDNQGEASGATQVVSGHSEPKV